MRIKNQLVAHDTSFNERGLRQHHRQQYVDDAHLFICTLPKQAGEVQDLLPDSFSHQLIEEQSQGSLNTLEELLLNNNEPYVCFPVAFVAYSSDITSIPKQDILIYNNYNNKTAMSLLLDPFHMYQPHIVLVKPVMMMMIWKKKIIVNQLCY
jgi:hypothetical protein